MRGCAKLLLAPRAVLSLLNPDWQRWVYKLSPSTAGQSVLSTVDMRGLPIGPWAGLAVVAAWAVALLTVGALTLRARDV